MRFNSKELAAVATQPSYKFDKEGVLNLYEKVEGLFRRSEVFHEKWFRLRGNLLFYCKTKDQYSEPAGVIVLEQCCISLLNSSPLPYSFAIGFPGEEQTHRFAASSESDREAWIKALRVASYEFVHSRLVSLRQELMKKGGGDTTDDTYMGAKQTCSFCKTSCKHLDPKDPLQNEPFLELSLACDNLQCDADGQPPNPIIAIYTLSSPTSRWKKFSQTEVVEKSSNPCFLMTIGFLRSEVASGTRVKLAIYDVREKLTSITTLLGEAVFSLGNLLQLQNNFMRMTLISPDCRCVGFVTVMACQLRPETASDHYRATLSASPADLHTWSKLDRPRSYSLPTCLSSRSGSPLYGQLRTLHDNVISQTYRFHTGLGGELRVHEIMAEPRMAFLIPQLLLNLWIKEEQKLMEILLGLGELRREFHSKHSIAIDRHLQLIGTYTQALEAILAQKKVSFKQSTQKTDPMLAFVPVNLHLQRLWVQNITTRKTGVYDVVTVGAFTAFSLQFKQGGLSKQLNQLRNSFPSCNDSPSAVMGPDRLSRAAEAVVRVEQLESDIEVDLQRLLNFAARQSSSELQAIITVLSSKAKQLTHICSIGLVEEAMTVWEAVRPPEFVAPTRQNPDSTEPVVATRHGPLHLSQSLDNGLHIDHHRPLKRQFSLAPWQDAPEVSFNTAISPIAIKCLRTTPDHLCITSLADCLPSPVGAAEEFEPLELTHLNIKASIMFMSSRVQVLQAGVGCCWVAELVPSVRKLRQAMQGLTRTAKLTYSLLALKEPPHHNSLSHMVKHRRDVVFSQALTSVVAALMCRLWCHPPDRNYLQRIVSTGLLVQFEGLLSCYSDNMAMLEDMVVGIEDLRRVVFWLEPTCSALPRPRVEGNRVFLNVVVPAPEHLMALLPPGKASGFCFAITCAFLNIGINETATLAETFGDVSLQERINTDGLAQLREYFRRSSRSPAPKKISGRYSPEVPVSDLLDQLQSQIHSRKCKNVDILHRAAEICRRLGGLRFTSCKSAKDRTGMAVTLEQAQVLQKDFHMDDKEFSRALACMRSQGTRRENTRKNVGAKKYAFNSLQLMALPKLYRPPPGTYGNVQT